ncbi:hypothetical protein [Paucisalibacillus globulus]|uniref:hypothetical protein n=1 Tax=Paucisalibacillus globulus TaxID=351095 RepID=UPI0004165C5B|nr:hypothetical protein [Paucisalibacillus globulus]
MNTTGFIRGYMAKNQDGEIFLKHVLVTVERQLQEWDSNYEVQLIKLSNYEVLVKNGKEIINFTISKPQLASFQSSSPYKLDQYIWRELKNNAVPIKDWNGNYLTYVFR